MIERKLKKCVICGEMFPPWNSIVKVCGIPCAITHTNNETKKKFRRERIEYQKKNESLSSLKNKARDEFNKFIRLRDHDKPCISCGTFTPGGDPRGGVWDCGHYRSVGSCPELRYDERNAHKQCKRCNRDLGGNVVEYRKGLLKIFTAEEMEALEGYHPPKHYTREELKEIATHYRQAAKQLKKLLEQP